MGQYNPNQPVIVGNEYAPVLQSNFQPNLFEERGYSFKSEAEHLYEQASLFVEQTPSWSVPGHAYLMTLYRRGQEVNTGPMKTVTIPLIFDGSANAAVGGGAPTSSQSFENPTDGWYFRLRSTSTAEAYLRTRTATIPTFLNEPTTTEGKRIVDVSIVYTSSAEVGNEEPVPLQINHYYDVTAERVSYGAAEVSLAESQITEISRSRWGEICTWHQVSTISPFTEDTSRYPWNYNLLTLFETGVDFLVEFRTAAAAQDGPREIHLHYAAMQITYCEENRVGTWGVVLGADYDLSGAGGAGGGYQLERNTQGATNGPGFVYPNSVSLASGGGSSSSSNSSPGAIDLTLTIKRADYGPYNNQGPPPLLRGLRTVGIFPSHPGVVISNTIEPGQVNQISASDLLPQLIPQAEPAVGQDDTEAPPLEFVHTYGRQRPLPVYLGNSWSQVLIETSDGTLVEYPNLRFWARHNGARAALRIYIETDHQVDVLVAELSLSEFEQFPEIADGWRQVDLTVDPALLINDDGTVLAPSAPRWESDTSAFQAWELLAEDISDDFFDPVNPTETGIGTYGDQNGQATLNGVGETDLDISVLWGQELPAIEGLAVEEATQALEVVDPDCPVAPGCIVDGIRYLAVSWTPIDSGYDFAQLGSYQLQRQDTTMDSDEWETVANAIHPLVDSFEDYEARVGVETSYRIRYVHTNGMTGVWSAPVMTEVIFPGVTGTSASVGVLIFTSNVDPGRNLAYVQTWQGAAAEDFDFVEAPTRDLQRMYGRDYQVAFRPAERGGVAFSRNLLVNSVRIPIETLRRGFESLRDLAWADLPYVCVRSERGDRWLSNVNVPSGTIRDRRRLYVAEVQITEVTGEPYAPEPTQCEGLTARGTLPSVTYEPRFATTPAGPHLDSDDLSLRVELRLDQDQSFPLVSRFDPTTSAVNAGWILQIRLDRTVIFDLRDGVGIRAAFVSDPVPFGPGDRYFLRFDYDMDGGGATSTGQFYTSPDGLVWTPLATTVVDNDSVDPGAIAAALPLVVGATFDGTADWAFGEVGGGSGGWNGVIPQVEVLGDAGAVLANPNFEEQAGTTVGFEDDQGNSWTVAGGVCTVDRRL